MLPKAKRLRGAQLQLAMDASETSGEPLPKGEQPSALAHLLLSLWSHGHLSASLIQQLAHMALLDGASHPELVSMAGCGNWGELAGNAQRDVMATFCADIQITPPVSIQVEVMDPKTSLHSVEDASLFLPHMLFSDLAHHHPEQFQTMFGLDKLKDFWLEVEKSEDDRLLGHPICLDKRQGLVKRQCSRKSLQSHFSSMQMGSNFKQGTAYCAGIGAVFSTSCTACPATFCCVLFQKAALWMAHGAHSWLGSNGL